VLARGVTDMMPPVGFAFWRWAVAFLLLLPFTWRRARKDWPAVVRAWRIMVLLSLLGITCFNTLLYSAVHTTTAINGALIQCTMPAFILLLSLALFKERVSLIQTGGVAISVTGAALVVLRGDLTALLDLAPVPGDVMMLVAVVLYALYSAYLRKRPAIDPLSFLTYTFGIGVLGLLPVYVWEMATGPLVPFTLPAIGSILYVALFPSILAYFCWNRGIELLGANRGGLFINLIPVFAAAMSIAWLGESLQGFHVLGMALIFGGMVLFNR
jgi:drug/metabolite transporter (DMT)-like permease